MWSEVLENYGVDASSHSNKQTNKEDLFSRLFVGLDEIIEVEDVRISR
jgi:hypothetical protein